MTLTAPTRFWPPSSSRPSRTVATTAGLSVTALLLAGCAGSLSTGAGGEGAAEGVSYGASAEEYQAALQDLEPISLTYQSNATGPERYFGQREVAMAERVEELSGGIVTVDVNWAGAIAPTAEVDDALADGRLDMASFSFSYEPKLYPVLNAVAESSVDGSPSPLTGELASHAAMAETAWNTPEVHTELEEKGLTPLIPHVPGGATALACKEPVESVDDFRGKQILASSETQIAQLEALGATPVSIDYTEVFDALQRGVLDCSFTAMTVHLGMGVLDVAPYVTLPVTTNFVLGPTAVLAGSSWEDLPLPVRQLVFDQMTDWSVDQHQGYYLYARDALEAVGEAGGEFLQLDPAADVRLQEVNAEVLAQVEASSAFDGAAYLERHEEAQSRWADTAGDLGYTDAGTYADFADWYEGDLTDLASSGYLRDFYSVYGEEVAAAHRPE
ncbi:MULTISPECIES: TRAP transporter substrate-binding protein DctP [Brevibacterium]|uniref:TRAP-type C4-dicarboxylate transport system, substrate-binding protein n=1 Tax=Brevibacterium salitolerans TaxID=1403566 RepID=A0ABN2WFK3_9MICO|nr:TRAP transporter substrate-binding protein DctP [Brevibacterium sp.]